MASSAANLVSEDIRVVLEGKKNEDNHEENWLSIRGLKINSLLIPPNVDGCTSYK